MSNRLAVLIEQVRKYLVDQNQRHPDRVEVYNRFFDESNELDLSAEEFFTTVLKVAYQQINFDELAEDPDPPNSNHTSIRIFGEEVHSLKKLGFILFENPRDAVTYFADATLIRSHVDRLGDADRAIEVTKLYNSEPDAVKRILRIIYYLNPALPYRIKRQYFPDLTALLDVAFRNYALYQYFFEEFTSGRLSIWVSATDPKAAAKLPVGVNYGAFLQFIYNYDGNAPFYIETEVFSSVGAISARAASDSKFWIKLFRCCDSGELFIWFDALKQPDWRKIYQEAWSSNRKLPEEEHVPAMVQVLLSLIDKAYKPPVITVTEDPILRLNLLPGEQASIPIKLESTGYGIVRSTVKLKETIKGFSLDKDHITLLNKSDKTVCTTVTLTIDPRYMKRKKVYDMELQLVSDSGDKVTASLQFRMSFPWVKYIGKVLVYGLTGAAFMGASRWLIGRFIHDPDSLPAKVIRSDIDHSLPANYKVYLVVFLMMLTLLLLAFPVVKKIEKI